MLRLLELVQPTGENAVQSRLKFFRFADSAPGCSRTEPKRWLVLLILLAAGIFVYLQVFILPATPRAAMGDQSIYLHSATRLYQGQLIYRDYDQLTFPGTDILYLLLFRLFGVRAWIPQMMLVLVGVVSTWLSISITKKITQGSSVFLPAFLFLTLPYASYLDATHHIYSVLAGMGALAVVLEERTKTRLAWAGVLWGLGTCFTQSVVLGPLAFAAFLLWEHTRTVETRRSLLEKEVSLFGGYVATVTAFNAYFVWRAGLTRFLDYTVRFPAKYFSSYEIGTWKTYMLGWPSVRDWINWPDLPAWPLIHLIIPLVYILFFVRYWREGSALPQESRQRLMLINVTGLTLFLTVASAPSWNRLYTVSEPALILLVWFLNSPFRLERGLLRMFWVTALVLAISRPIVTQVRWKAFLDLPTGRTAFFQTGLYQETKWVSERTRPLDYFFGDFCFALHLRNPSRVIYVTPFAFTRPEEVLDLVQALDVYKVRWMTWYPGLDAPDAARENNLGPLRSYLQGHYHVAGSFPNGNTIWERNDLASSFPSHNFAPGN